MKNLVRIIELLLGACGLIAFALAFAAIAVLSAPLMALTRWPWFRRQAFNSLTLSRILILLPTILEIAFGAAYLPVEALYRWRVEKYGPAFGDVMLDFTGARSRLGVHRRPPAQPTAAKA